MNRPGKRVLLIAAAVAVLAAAAVLLALHRFGRRDFARGIEAYNRREYERAVACFEAALRRRPDDPETLDMLRRAQGRRAAQAGAACVERGDYEGAVRELSKAAELLPEDWAVRRDLASAHAWHAGAQVLAHVCNGDMDRAAAAFPAVLERLDSSGAGEAFVRRARWWQSMFEALRSYLREDDEAAVVALQGALRYADGGEPTRAMATPEYWRSLLPDEAEALFAPGPAPRGPGSILRPERYRVYANAVDRVGTGALTRMLLAMSHRRLGQRAYDQGRFAEAISAFDNARRYWPDWPELYYDLGFAHYRNQDYASAVLRLVEARRLAPDDPRFAKAWEDAKAQVLGDIKASLDDALTVGARRLDTLLKELARRHLPPREPAPTPP